MICRKIGLFVVGVVGGVWVGEGYIIYEREGLYCYYWDKREIILL